MLRLPQIAKVFLLALLSSIACEAAAQQAVPNQPSQRQELPAARDPQPMPDRLANPKARLRLSTEQEKLWGSVEEAVRDLQARTRDLRSFSLAEVDQDDQVGRLRRLGELSAQRADALKRMADAVQPLWATLSNEQKREMPRFAGVAARDDLDRAPHRGRRNFDDDDRRYSGGSWRDHHRFDDGGSGRRGDYGRHGDPRDDEQGWRGREDRYRYRYRDHGDFRAERRDSYRWRDGDGGRRDFDRRSEHHLCRCYDRD